MKAMILARSEYIIGALAAAVLGITAQESQGGTVSTVIVIVTALAGAFGTVVVAWLKGYFEMRTKGADSSAALLMTDRQLILTELNELRGEVKALREEKVEAAIARVDLQNEVDSLHVRLDFQKREADLKSQLYTAREEAMKAEIEALKTRLSKFEEQKNASN